MQNLDVHPECKPENQGGNEPGNKQKSSAMFFLLVFGIPVLLMIVLGLLTGR